MQAIKKSERTSSYPRNSFHNKTTWLLYSASVRLQRGEKLSGLRDNSYTISFPFSSRLLVGLDHLEYSRCVILSSQRGPAVLRSACAISDIGLRITLGLPGSEKGHKHCVGRVAVAPLFTVRGGLEWCLGV